MAHQPQPDSDPAATADRSTRDPTPATAPQPQHLGYFNPRKTVIVDVPDAPAREIGRMRVAFSLCWQVVVDEPRRTVWLPGEYDTSEQARAAAAFFRSITPHRNPYATRPAAAPDGILLGRHWLNTVAGHQLTDNELARLAAALPGRPCTAAACCSRIPKQRRKGHAHEHDSGSR